MIDIEDIKEGDIISVSDGFNRARGKLFWDRRWNLCIDALGQDIVILKRSPGQRMTLLKGIKIEDHQPQLYRE